MGTSCGWKRGGPMPSCCLHRSPRTEKATPRAAATLLRTCIVRRFCLSCAPQVLLYALKGSHRRHAAALQRPTPRSCGLGDRAGLLARPWHALENNGARTRVRPRTRTKACQEGDLTLFRGHMARLGQAELVARAEYPQAQRHSTSC